MTFRVEIEPSGHRFTLEPGESLLDAALRSGLSVRYSCNSGSCGECRARVLRGEVAALAPADYPLTEAERAAGAVLMCRTTAASDLVLEAVEASGVQDVPEQEIQTTVSRLKPLADDIIELQLRTPRSKTLWFLAGQYAVLETVDGIRHAGSIASCPCNGMLLQFHVARDDADPFAGRVFDGLKLRDQVRVRGPYGDFVLDEDSKRPAVFIAWETGFAAIKSLIEHAIALEVSQPLRLYWAVGYPGGHYMENFARSWREALDDYDFVPLVGGPAGEEVAAALGRADLTLRDADVYVSGPPPFVEGLRPVLLAAGVPPGRLFTDRLQPRA